MGFTDEQLWEALRQGKEEALSQLFMQQVDGLYNYGYMLCRDKEMVEDCIQDLFLQIWRKRANLSEVNKVRSYLMVALRNRIQDAFRQKKGISLEKYEEAAGESDLSPEQQWIAKEYQSLQSEVVEKGVNALPARMKQAIYLRYVEGFEYTDIACIMNVSQQVAVNMVYRATLKLRAFSKRYSEWLYFFLFLFFL